MDNKNREFIGIDDKYVPEQTPEQVERSIKYEEKEKKAEKFAKKYIKFHFALMIIVPLFAFGMMAFMIFAGMGQMKSLRNSFQSRVSDSTRTNDSNSSSENTEDTEDTEVQDISPTTFNRQYEDIQGSKLGADWRIDNIVLNNKKNTNHIISFTYHDQTYTTEEEIRTLKQTLDKWTHYEYSVNYDENGYVNNITIYDIEQ